MSRFWMKRGWSCAVSQRLVSYLFQRKVASGKELTDDSRSDEDEVEHCKQALLQITDVGTDLPERESSEQANDDVGFI